MGQQQILLLVLGTVIVGLAIFVGVQTFTDGVRHNAADNLMNSTVVLAQEAVAWRGRSHVQGGGENSYAGLSDATVRVLGVDSTDTIGTYAFDAVSPSSVTLVGVSHRHPDIGVRVTVTNTEITDTQLRFDGSITLP